MDLDCFLFPGWHPLIRPADRRRDWMDGTPESFAYRCLPLAIANAHGWEIGNPLGFCARWTGGSDTDAVEIRMDDGQEGQSGAPVSLFGQGTITFHIEGLFRTAPGWNLWLGGPPNGAKDGIAPLSGVIETDWSPYTFTMNWRFTRPNEWVRFEPGETIGFFFPVQRGALDGVAPRFRAIDEAPELKAKFEAWSRSRDAFHQQMRDAPPIRPADKWQKLYYRGVDPDGVAGAADHQSKIATQPFTPPLPERPLVTSGAQACPVADHATEADPTLAKRDWLLRVQSELRALSPAADDIYVYDDIDPQTFLDDHYALNRPCILAGEIATWPAMRWTPEQLIARVGEATVEYQGGREANDRFELDKDRHLTRAPFPAFMAAITGPDATNDAYLTAYNSGANAVALAPLRADMRPLDKILSPSAQDGDGMLWIGPRGSFTPLHHDLTNNLLVQIVGRKRVVLAPPSETPLLANHEHVFSAIGNILDPANTARFPDMVRARVYEVLLEPGQALFIPIGWWHQVEALDFSVSATYTNFRWRNDWYRDYPGQTA